MPDERSPTCIAADAMRGYLRVRFGALSLPSRFAVQQPAAEYADKRRDDEKVEQREILENRRHGLLLLFPPLEIIT
ncbi:hypothetical protein HFN01_18885 [Rhizobium leguminosarum]|uniref:hypothetical protein n=1 Tax=Rhizobium leguminosarum TaxID=384 RepID=UPI001C97E475|nr:hypothetical protein [Rhizobium leguminosarum]MBY5396878.1 hypothetical protein [Rhizobium leguminosarum]